MSNAAGHTYSATMSDSEAITEQLTQSGIKGDPKKLLAIARQFGDNPTIINLLTAYLKRWYAGRLNGLETIPGLLDENHETAINLILSAFENKLKGASDLTLLYLLSLSERPVPQQHMKEVFRSTLMERWLTRRDDYVRFLGPLGRLNEEHWHWVIENLRRLRLLEEPISGQHDLLFVARPIRDHFSNNLREHSQSIFDQASADMEKLFQDTVVEFKQRYRSTPAIKTWISPELQEQLQLNDETEEVKDPAAVLWKREELDTAQDQLKALRNSLGVLKTQTDRLHEQLSQNKLSLVEDNAHDHNTISPLNSEVTTATAGQDTA